MIISKNKSKVTKKNLRAFQSIEIIKKSWPVIIFSLLVTLFSFRIQGGILVLDSVFILVVGLLSTPFYAAFTLITLRKSNKNFKEGEVLYTFTTDCIQVTEKVENGATSTLDYDKIYKVLEKKNQIYLYLDNTSALVVDKDGFVEGTWEKTLALLNLKVKPSKSK